MSKASASLAAEIAELDSRVKRLIQSGVSSMHFSAIEIAQLAAKEAQDSLDHMGTFNEYIDPRTGVSRTSSQPGEPPVSPPGNPLSVSVKAVMVSSPNSNPAVAGFGTDSEYGKYLEYGTSRMSPRPFMRPAALKMYPIAEGVTARNWIKNINKIAKTMKRQNLTVNFSEGP
jgi:HK97 gp10 family phage protein